MIIDSNVVIHAFIPGDLTAKARHVLSQVGLCAPDILIAEVANVFGRMVRTRAIDGAQAAELYASVKKLPLRLVPSREVLDRAFELSLELGHPIFDCYYLETAIRERLPLVTADARFIQKLKAHSHTLSPIHLNDWPA